MISETSYTSATLEALREKARVIRVKALKEIACAQSGHPGGSLSCADILAALFFFKMRLNREDPHWEGRDLFVLSKGHGAPALYAVLSELGFVPEEDLCQLRQLGSNLQGHPDRNKTLGVDASTGSLGQGLSMAVGMALSLRLDRSDRRVYVVLGDGEMQEGQVWEALLKAGNSGLDNLTVIVDANGLQLDNRVEAINDLSPLRAKGDAFKWETQEIDGHDMESILKALEKCDQRNGKPHMIVARTVKGKGVSFMENQVKFHGKAPSSEQLEKALQELSADR